MKDQLQNLRKSHLRLCCYRADRHLRHFEAPHSNYASAISRPYHVLRFCDRGVEITSYLLIFTLSLSTFSLWSYGQLKNA